MPTLTQRRKARSPARRHPGVETTDAHWFRWRRIEAERHDLPHGHVGEWRYAYADAEDALKNLRDDMRRYTPQDILQVENVDHPPLDWLEAEFEAVRAKQESLALYRDTVRQAIAKASGR